MHLNLFSKTQWAEFWMKIKAELLAFFTDKAILECILTSSKEQSHRALAPFSPYSIFFQLLFHLCPLFIVSPPAFLGSLTFFMLFSHGKHLRKGCCLLQTVFNFWSLAVCAGLISCILYFKSHHQQPSVLLTYLLKEIPSSSICIQNSFICSWNPFIQLHNCG